MRRCYLNPNCYQNYRHAFMRAGFEIVDCPPVTSQGKTSTDIHMVLDMVDLLQHDVHYDEFIVFSADADFTPVLRKLRRWDRRTTVLAIGFPSAAYQASADLLIEQDDFVRAGLGFEDPEEPPPAPSPERSQADIARGVARFIADAVASSGKPVALPWLASKAPAEIEGLDAADWAGFNSFRSLVDSLELEPLVVSWEFGVVVDPSRHAFPERAATVPGIVSKADPRLDDVARLVRDEVERTRRPVACARLAQIITDQHGSVAADWGGKGTFRKFLEALDLCPLRIDWSAAGGQVSDPRFDSPSSASTPIDWGSDNDLLPIANQVRVAIGMPLLSPPELRFLLGSLASDLAQQPFALAETGKRVRDCCRNAGHAISRSDVSFVLKGILLGGHVFGQDRDDERTLASRLVNQILFLCEREQKVLSQAEIDHIKRWIGGTGETQLSA